MSKLMSTLASDDKPLTWRLAVVLLAGGAVGALGATWMDGAGIVLAMACGAFLSMLAIAGPMLMALRVIATIGALTIAAVGLATATVGSPWLSAIIMAILAFAGSLWTAVPLVGPLAGGFPAMLFLLVTTRGVAVTGDQDWLHVALAASIGVLAAAIVTVGFNITDPLGGSRKAVAAAWGPEATLRQHGATAQALRFDGQPRRLSFLLALASLSLLGRKIAQDDSDPVPEVTAGIAVGSAGDTAVQETLLPRGRLVPRSVDLNLAAMQPGLEVGSKAQRLGLGQWNEALTRARSVLSGQTEAPAARKLGVGLLASMLRSLLSPDSAVFRFGVQRAIGLGLGMFILVQTVSESAFWILLTILAVLQVNSPETGAKVLQRSVGTLAGALGAVLVAMVVPAAVLVPWASVVVIMVGIAYVQRNYAVMSAAVAAAIVWFLGAAHDDTWTWATARIIDTIVGAVIAFALATFVLPVRPEPERRRQAVIAGLGRLRAGIELFAKDPSRPGLGRLFGPIGVAFSNYEADAARIPEQDRAPIEADIESLNNQWDRLNALVLLARTDIGQIEGCEQLLSNGLNQVKDSLSDLAEAGIAATEDSSGG